MEKTIENLRKSLENVLEDIDRECREWHHNCQACSYERLCGYEIEAAVSRLKEAYCEDAKHDCSKCDYLNECTTVEAKNEVKRQKHEQHLKDCADANGKCRSCKHFLTHCTFVKGHKAWLEFVEECCAKPYGCLKCPELLCSEEKHQHFLYLQERIIERSEKK